MSDVREVTESGDSENIKSKVSDLQKALMKIGEEISKKSGGGDGQSGPETATNSTEEEQEKKQ